MCIIENRVPDYDLCKKAYSMGLRFNTFFKYDNERNLIIPSLFKGVVVIEDDHIWHTDFLDTYSANCIPAPISSDIILPDWIDNNWFQTRIYEGVICGYVDEDGSPDEWTRFTYSLGEAHARLKTAIYICENIQGGKEWFKEQGLWE